jgi:hypothetical protein
MRLAMISAAISGCAERLVTLLTIISSLGLSSNETVKGYEHIEQCEYLQLVKQLQSSSVLSVKRVTAVAVECTLSE